MADVIRRTVVRGPARLLVNERSATRPQTALDVVDRETFEPVNNWRDIGATRHGILEVNDAILVVFAESTTERVIETVPSGPFQLAAVWNSAEEADETTHLALQHYPSVQIKDYDGELDERNPFPMPTVFTRYP